MQEFTCTIWVKYRQVNACMSSASEKCVYGHTELAMCSRSH
jgi:hypothetical protein